jgi:hypothetical protein
MINNGRIVPIRCGGFDGTGGLATIGDVTEVAFLANFVRVSKSQAITVDGQSRQVIEWRNGLNNGMVVATLAAVNPSDSGGSLAP